jgi:hypothetical protein
MKVIMYNFKEMTKAKWMVKTTETCIRGNTIHNGIELGINKTRNDIGAKIMIL